MAKFRKKPVEIEAFRAAEAMRALPRGDDVPPWLGEAYRTGVVTIAADHVAIRTLEGLMRAEPGDMIIRGVKGELYSCKPDIFDATYEPAEG